MGAVLYLHLAFMTLDLSLDDGALRHAINKAENGDAGPTFFLGMVRGTCLKAVGLNTRLAVLLRLVKHEVIVLGALGAQILKRMELLFKRVVGALAVIGLTFAHMLQFARLVAIVKHLPHVCSAPRF